VQTIVLLSGIMAAGLGVPLDETDLAGGRAASGIVDSGRVWFSFVNTAAPAASGFSVGLLKSQPITPVTPSLYPPVHPPGVIEERIYADYAFASAGVGLLEVVSILVNTGFMGSAATRRWSGPVGVGIGALGIALGAIKVNEGWEVGTLGAVNMVVGAATAVLGFRAILTRDNSPSQETAAPVILIKATGGNLLGVRLTF